MGTEIERKFLVRDDGWRADAATSAILQQGYLSVGEPVTVRVRREANQAWLNIKGPSQGLARAEFEYTIPIADAEALLGLCHGNLVEKRRHRIPRDGKVWEVDEFLGANAGLIVAEVELLRADEPFTRPAWLGREVSLDRRFQNASLSQKPFASWSVAEQQECRL